MATSRTFTCRICCEEFEEGAEGADKIILVCNPEHTFCRSCIVDWYQTCKPEYRRYGNVTHRRFIAVEDLPMRCPICNQYGGCLPKSSPGKERVDIFPNFIYRPSREYCFCRENATHFCLSQTGYSSMDLPKKRKDCTIFTEEEEISVCQIHYIRFMEGRPIEHYNYGKISLVVDTCEVVDCYGLSKIAGHYRTNHATGKRYHLCPGHRRRLDLQFKDGFCFSKSRGFYREDDPVPEETEAEPLTICRVSFVTKKGICKRMGSITFAKKCYLHRDARFVKAEV